MCDTDSSTVTLGSSVQALQCRVECDHLAGQLVGMVQDALTNMNMTNQYHPLVLQGIVQWQMLEESPEMPLEFTWDAMWVPSLPVTCLTYRQCFGQLRSLFVFCVAITKLP